MAATPSIKVTKSLMWRDVLTFWSNRYHFNGGTPADGTHWTTLSDAIVTAEKAALYSSCIITGTTGYAAGSEVPVFTKTYSTTGTLAAGSDTVCPGDIAALVRYSTTAKTSKNHPIYLFNYYHGCKWDATEGAPDEIAPGQKSALSTYATSWVSGFSDGSLTLVRAGPNGATATGSLVADFLTTHDFPR